MSDDSEQVARAAIAIMQSNAEVFHVLAEAQWMNELDPAGTGPKAVCTITALHNERLAAELTARLAPAKRKRNRG
jgi:hypothetical protein